MNYFVLHRKQDTAYTIPQHHLEMEEFETNF